jgi:pimeloyl-ACP methyl ester carboxylesterase
MNNDEGVALRWRNSGGQELFARTWNHDGYPGRRTAILIHGLTQNSLMFIELAHLLAAQGVRVVAMDVRGRGESAREGPYSLTEYARDTIELCEHLGVKRAFFIGTSMGGMITLCVAKTKPELVAGAVLNDIGPELGIEGVKR